MYLCAQRRTQCEDSPTQSQTECEDSLTQCEDNLKLNVKTVLHNSAYVEVMLQ